MAWFFEGTGAQLGLQVSAEGNLSAYGTCSQLCRPDGGADINRYVDGIEGGWNLHASDAAEHEYDGLGHGLKDFFEQNGGRAAGLITYLAANEQHPAIVSASIVMPHPAFQDAISLLRLAMGEPKIRYVITLDFLGVSNSGSTRAMPNLADFVNSDIVQVRSYLSNKVSVSVLSY